MAKIETQGRGMSRERFETILGAYGACPDGWPLVERESALAYLEKNVEMRDFVQREAELDALLGKAIGYEASGELRGKVLAGVPEALSWWERVDGWASGLWPIGKNWQPVGALAFAGLLGLSIGYWGQTQEPTAQATSADMVELALGDASGFGELP